MRKVSAAVWVGIFFIILFAIFELSAIRRAAEGRLLSAIFWFEKPVAYIFARTRTDFGIARLLEENRRLLEEISRLTDLREESKILESLRASSPASHYLAEALSARVIGSSPEKAGIIFLDKGFEAGINQGDIVFLPNNTLIGYIDRVYGTFSIAKTLFSEDIALSAYIGEERLQGLFSNSSGDEVGELSLIPRAGKIEPGFIVKTSGKDGVIPAGLLLGVVDAVQDLPAEATRKATVRLLFLPALLDYVLIAENPLTQ